MATCTERSISERLKESYELGAVLGKEVCGLQETNTKMEEEILNLNNVIRKLAWQRPKRKVVARRPFVAEVKVLGGEAGEDDASGSPPDPIKLTIEDQEIEELLNTTKTVSSTSGSPPVQTPFEDTLFRRSVTDIMSTLRIKSPSWRAKSATVPEDTQPEEGPPLNLLDRMMENKTTGKVTPTPTPSDDEGIPLECLDSEAELDSDGEMPTGETVPFMTSQNIDLSSATVEDYCTNGDVHDKTDSSPPHETPDTWKNFDLAQWVANTVANGGRAMISTHDVLRHITKTSRIPGLSDLHELIYADEAAAADKRCKFNEEHSSLRNLKQTLTSLRYEMLKCGAGSVCSVSTCSSSGSENEAKKAQNHLRKMEKELAVVQDRLGSGKAVFLSEMVMRDFQQLRTLEGMLAVQIHNIAPDDGSIEDVRYQAALVREQKLVILQKDYILRNKPLKTFYVHLCRCLSATFLLLRGMKYFPLNMAAIPYANRKFVEYLYDLLPHAAVLFECGQSIADTSGVKVKYDGFSLADIDVFVDAVALSLCKKHEQQLSMLTPIETVRGGCVGAADWAVGVVIEAIRQNRANPAFPIADQLVNWVSGRTLLHDEGYGKRVKVYTVSDPVLPGEEAVVAGWKLPREGLVQTAAPSEHLRWSAEGVFRFCGIRTFTGELFGFDHPDRERGYHHYGFATDTALSAKDNGMIQVSSLLWGSQPNSIWQDDTEFLALNPIMFTYASPVAYTLLFLSSPILSGGLLISSPTRPSPSSDRSKRGWSSRTGTKRKK